LSDEHRAKLAEGQRRRFARQEEREKHAEAMRKRSQDPTWLANIRASRKTMKRNFQPSRYEEMVAEELTRRGIEFLRQVRIGRFTVDFLLGDHVIEVFGCWPHDCPRCYEEEMLLGTRQFDELRTQILQDAGFRVSIIWSHELDDDVEAAVRRGHDEFVKNERRAP
jgi:very-short-patch-repair endonuclease